MLRWIAFKAVNKLVDRSINGVLLSYRDIDEEQRVQQRLQATLSQLRATFESAPVGVILASSGNRIVDVNPTAAKLLGYKKEELIGLHGRDLNHPADLARRPPSAGFRSSSSRRRPCLARSTIGSRTISIWFTPCSNCKPPPAPMTM